MDKPIVIFTNFWDAEKIINQGYITSYSDKSFYKINLYNEPKNFVVHSIALSHPPLTRLPTIKSMEGNFKRLDMFCPTYNLLIDYKTNGNWENYVKIYRSILKTRKNEITEWIDNLKPNFVYILCCWENTSKGAHCHRELIYDALIQSANLKNKALYVKRTGGKEIAFENSKLYQEIKSYYPLNSQTVKQNPEDLLTEIMQSDQSCIQIVLDEWGVGKLK